MSGLGVGCISPETNMIQVAIQNRGSFSEATDKDFCTISMKGFHQPFDLERSKQLASSSR